MSKTSEKQQSRYPLKQSGRCR